MNKFQTVIDLIEQLASDMNVMEYHDYLIEIKDEMDTRIEALEENELSQHNEEK